MSCVGRNQEHHRGHQQDTSLKFNATIHGDTSLTGSVFGTLATSLASHGCCDRHIETKFATWADFRPLTTLSILNGIMLP
jgi:hypothetical protein